jgi:hypothetical protein
VLQEQNNGVIMVHSDFQMTPEDQALKNESFLHFPQALSILAEHNSDCIGILTDPPPFISKLVGSMYPIFQSSFCSLIPAYA